MLKHHHSASFTRFSILLCFVSLMSWAQIGDGPIIKEHISQDDIESGALSFGEIFEAGKELFIAKFNTFDGQGRPGTTGGGDPRVPGSAPSMLRTSAPDANSCAGCHNDPLPGTAGDFVANVFVLAQTLDPVTFSVSPEFSNNRNTLGMSGSGAIEMLAREMTTDLLEHQTLALAEAQVSGEAVTRALFTKGVFFGSITANPDGTVDTSNVDGVDADLIIKPFHQKGAVISLREFSNNAFNHHHGMQSVERFGVARTGTDDFDEDGVPDELTVGDITATTIWQAGLSVPGQVISTEPAKARAIIRGERTFSRVGCGDCHIPELELENAVFSEPNPFNKPGNLRPEDVSAPYNFDLTTHGDLPRLEPNGTGGAIVRAFTDLKRHNLCDEDFDHYCNEQVVQAGIPTEEFLTKKLWVVGNTAPYGHRGDLTTLTAAVHFHGGEARESRDRFFALPQHQRDEVFEFLKSLQILDPQVQHLVVDEDGNFKNKRKLQQKFLNGEPTRDIVGGK